MAKTYIFNLKNGKNAGDDNNALGVATALKGSYEGAELQTIDIAEMSSFLETFSPAAESKYVFVGAGEQCLSPLSDIKGKSSGANIKAVWSSHQYYDSVATAQADLDCIVLPKHVLDNKELPIEKSKIIASLGVPHMLSKETVLKAYEDNKDKIIPTTTGYVTAVMGGDANRPDGTMQYYTVEEAVALAKFLAKIVKKTGRTLLVTNGPRTGKFTPETKAETLNHRDVDPKTKEVINTPMDPCSKAMLETLEASGLKSGVDFQLSDFRFKEKGVDSAYQRFLGATISTPDSIMLMAGESTSMITECIDTMPKGYFGTFHNKAMNDDHHAYVDMLNSAGLIDVLDLDFKLVARKLGEKIELSGKTVTQHVAEAVFKKISAEPKRGVRPSVQP